jgi:hypothetical protein
MFEHLGDHDRLVHRVTLLITTTHLSHDAPD